MPFVFHSLTSSSIFLPAVCIIPICVTNYFVLPFSVSLSRCFLVIYFVITMCLFKKTKTILEVSKTRQNDGLQLLETQFKSVFSGYTFEERFLLDNLDKILLNVILLY